jgi:valyl-tRNA synthetase
LTKLRRVIERVTNAMEEMRFNEALDSIRNFVWHVFCDHYLEAVKYRLYGQSTAESRKAAQYTLTKSLYVVLRLLAPFCPFITEEIYQAGFKERVGVDSIHLTSWPDPSECEFDEDLEAKGDVVVSTIAAVRRTKIRNRLSPGHPLKVLKIGTPSFLEAIKLGSEDIRGTCRVRELIIADSLDDGIAVDEYPEIRFSFQAE